MIHYDSGFSAKYSIKQLMDNGQLIELNIRSAQRRLYMFVFPMVAFIAVIIILMRRLISKKDVVPQYYQELLDYGKASYRVEELDNLFEITSLGYDATRKRRSELIKSINTYHKKKFGTELIIRQKDSADKRRVIYKIQNAVAGTED